MEVSIHISSKNQSFKNYFCALRSYISSLDKKYSSKWSVETSVSITKDLFFLMKFLSFRGVDGVYYHSSTMLYISNLDVKNRVNKDFLFGLLSKISNISNELEAFCLSKRDRIKIVNKYGSIGFSDSLFDSLLVSANKPVYRTNGLGQAWELSEGAAGWTYKRLDNQYRLRHQKRLEELKEHYSPNKVHI